MTIQSDQILEYIDGMLDPESEQALFDALARQPELRLAMRQFISIGDAVRADREAYAPPAEVERSLMAGIGLSAAELGFATSVGFFERLSMFGSRYFGVIAAFLLGLLLSGVLVYMVMAKGEGDTRMAGTMNTRAAQTQAAQGSQGSSLPSQGAPAGSSDRGASAQWNASANGGSSNVNNNTEQSSGTAPASAAQAPAAIAQGSNAASTTNNTNIFRHDLNAGDRGQRSGYEAPFSATTNRARLRASASGGGSNVRKDRASASENISSNAINSQTSTTDGASSTSSLGTTSTLNASSTSAASSTSVVPVQEAKLRHADVREAASYGDLNAHRSPSSMPLEAVTDNSIADVDDSREHGVITEARYQMGGSLNESNARAIGSAGRDAYALGAYYKFTPALSLGLEGGNESYDQTLRYRNGDTLQIDQRPNYYWGGLALRYYLGALSFGNLEPYVQPAFGLTSAGPVLRFRLGTQFDFGSNVSATVNGEFSSLFYTFDQQRLTSGRWGVSGGIQYTIR